MIIEGKVVISNICISYYSSNEHRDLSVFCVSEIKHDKQLIILDQFSHMFTPCSIDELQQKHNQILTDLIEKYGKHTFRQSVYFNPKNRRF